MIYNIHLAKNPQFFTNANDFEPSSKKNENTAKNREPVLLCTEKK